MTKMDNQREKEAFDKAQSTEVQTMTLPYQQRLRWLVGSVFVVLGLGGCGDTRPVPADRDRAVEALQTALEAWKQGLKPDDLRQRSPAINFNDSECAAGRRLVGFKMPDASEAFGNSIRIRVELTFEAEDKTVVKEVGYLIDTAPALAIVRMPSR